MVVGAGDRKTLTQRRKEETRANILEAAYQVFARRGYEAATIDEIAAECEISKGALYHHFSSKEELFQTLLRSRFQNPVRLVLSSQSPEPVLDLEATVRASVEAAWEEAQGDPLWERLWQEALAQADRNPAVSAIIAEFHERAQGAVVETLVAGQQAGVVRADLDVGAACAVLTAMLDGGISRSLSQAGDLDPRPVIEATIDAMVRYLRP